MSLDIGSLLRRRSLSTLCVLACIACLPVVAATPVASIRYSADITLVLSGQTASDDTVVDDDLVGQITPIDLGGLAAAVDVDAFHEDDSGDRLFSFDTVTVLSGSLTAHPADVVRYDGATYVLEFDSSAAGVIGGNVDAVTRSAGGELLLSFDSTIDLGGLIVHDEDLVAYDGIEFSLEFDGSVAGLAPGLDLDAAHLLESNGHLLLSFDISGEIGGVVFDDEDVLELDPTIPTWQLVIDGSLSDAAWRAADLDALHAVESCQLDSPVSPYPADEATLCTSPARLVWAPTVGADYHEIDIDGPSPFACEGSPLDDSCDLSGEPLAAGAHTWQVTAHLGVYPTSECASSGPVWTFVVDPAAPPENEVCDGLDNDCNGAVDDGLGTTTCGQGACLSAIETCVNGETQACVPGEPTTEVCDDVDNDCNGMIDEDENGEDSDGDGVANLCDSCPMIANRAQSDLDDDGEGDPCDLNDGMIHVSIELPISVEYQLEAGYSAFNVYRGRWDRFLATGEYTQDPSVVPRAGRWCGQTAGVLFDVFDFPEAGELLFYLVAGVSGIDEGSLGTDSAGAERANANACP